MTVLIRMGQAVLCPPLLAQAGGTAIPGMTCPLTLGLLLVLLNIHASWCMELCAPGHHGRYMRIGWGEWHQTLTLHVSASPVHPLLCHWTSLTKKRFKEKIIKNFEIVTVQH